MFVAEEGLPFMCYVHVWVIQNVIAWIELIEWPA